MKHRASTLHGETVQEALAWACLRAPCPGPTGIEQERKIPRQDFPEENPQIGQLFFAEIEETQPDKLLVIEPLPVDKGKRSFEEILRSLFGDEAYEKAGSILFFIGKY